MSKLLYIESSPHGAASHSGSVARELLAARAALHPEEETDHIDVWNLDLPAFDAEMIAAKFAVLRAQQATSAQRARWDEAVKIARRFNSADRFVFSLPMWNFGLPYRLKHFIDVVTLAGENWMWSRESGYRPLLKDKRAVLVYSGAGTYPQDSISGLPNQDFQKPYMRQWLRFIGIQTVHEIEVAPTLAGPEQVAQMKVRVIAQAREAGMAL